MRRAGKDGTSCLTATREPFSIELLLNRRSEPKSRRGVRSPGSLKSETRAACSPLLPPHPPDAHPAPPPRSHLQEGGRVGACWSSGRSKKADAHVSPDNRFFTRKAKGPEENNFIISVFTRGGVNLHAKLACFAWDFSAFHRTKSHLCSLQILSKTL